MFDVLQLCVYVYIHINIYIYIYPCVFVYKNTHIHTHADMRRLMKDINSEKRVVKKCRRCVNVHLNKPQTVQYSLIYTCSMI